MQCVQRNLRLIGKLSEHLPADEATPKLDIKFFLSLVHVYVDFI